MTQIKIMWMIESNYKNEMTKISVFLKESCFEVQVIKNIKLALLYTVNKWAECYNSSGGKFGNF